MHIQSPLNCLRPYLGYLLWDVFQKWDNPVKCQNISDWFRAIFPHISKIMKGGTMSSQWHRSFCFCSAFKTENKRWWAVRIFCQQFLWIKQKNILSWKREGKNLNQRQLKPEETVERLCRRKTDYLDFTFSSRNRFKHERKRNSGWKEGITRMSGDLSRHAGGQARAGPHERGRRRSEDGGRPEWKRGGGGNSLKKEEWVRWRRRGPDGDRGRGGADRLCQAGTSLKETESLAESKIGTDTNWGAEWLREWKWSRLQRGISQLQFHLYERVKWQRGKYWRNTREE